MSDGIPKNPEKRHYQRLDAELPVELEVNGMAIRANSENISCGGMYLPQVVQSVDPEAPIIAYINLPGEFKPVRLAGRVLRVHKLEDKTHALAIQFSGLYDDNHLTLDRYVKWKLLN